MRSSTVLLSRHLRTVRWIAMSLLVGGVGIACALASAAVTDPVAPTKSPASDNKPRTPSWAVASAPARVVDSVVTLTATQTGARLAVEYKIILENDDPLLDEIRSGDVSGSKLIYYFFGGTDYNYSDLGLTSKSNFMQPSLESASGRSTATARFGLVAEGSSTARSHQIELEDIDDAPFSAALASKRTWTVHAKGFRIIGVDGQPVRQDANTVVFQGPPGQASVKFERDWKAASPKAASSADEQPLIDDTSVEELGPFAPLAYLVTAGWISWLLTLTMPWFALLLTAGDTTNPGRVQAARRVAIVVLSSLPVVGIIMNYFGSRINDIVVMELTIVAPTVVASTIRQIAGQPWWTRRLLAVQCAAAVAAVSFGLTFALNSGSTVHYGILVAALVVGACTVAGLVGLLFGRRDAIAGSSLGLLIISAVIAGTQLDTIRRYAIDKPLVGLLVLGVLGLLATNVTLALVCLWEPRRPAAWIAISMMTGVLLFMPILQLLHNPIDAVNFVWIQYYRIGYIAPFYTVALNILLSIVALGLMRRYGCDSTALQRPFTWTLGVVLVLSLTYKPGPFSWVDLLGVVAIWIALWWLLPLDRREEVVRFGTVTPRAHTQLIRAEIRRRIVQLSAHDLYRGARAHLSTGEIKINDYNRRQRVLDDASSPSGKEFCNVPLGYALSTNAGCMSWQNALASVRYAAPIAVLVMTYEAWTFIENSYILNFPDLVKLLDTARHLARWLGYALIFGYFYPLLRGRTPVAKGLALGLAILAAEIPRILEGVDSDPSSDFSDLGVVAAVVIRTGQVIVFCFVLGLAWERRLGQLAGFTWDRLRNIRSINALAAPATTVVIAAATTLVTAFAGAVAAGFLAPSPTQVPEFKPPDTSSSSVQTPPPTPR